MKIDADKITIVGYLLIVFWFTHIFYLYPTPFQDSYFEGSKNLISDLYDKPEETRTGTLFEGISKQEIIKKAETALCIHWLKYFAIIIVGIVSGMLTIKKKKLGFIIAIALCGTLLVSEIWNQIHFFKSIPLFFRKYQILLKIRPILTFHQSILSPLFYLFITSYLLYIIANSKLKPIKTGGSS